MIYFFLVGDVTEVLLLPSKMARLDLGVENMIATPPFTSTIMEGTFTDQLAFQGSAYKSQY